MNRVLSLEAKIKPRAYFYTLQFKVSHVLTLMALTHQHSWPSGTNLRLQFLQWVCQGSLLSTLINSMNWLIKRVKNTYRFTYCSQFLLIFPLAFRLT